MSNKKSNIEALQSFNPITKPISSKRESLKAAIETGEELYVKPAEKEIKEKNKKSGIVGSRSLRKTGGKKKKTKTMKKKSTIGVKK